ncbi:four helix bundle protein [candidate division KSB1 bacterium]|nr:four helix bundle protein [candidate division KSB1 bacterium]RQW10184.1 MAG: four helix bundle protein [candidate division KSB1 bacterium]
MDLSIEVYKATQIFPKNELYGLTAQMRSCAVSISSNIAEGAGRASKADFSRFIRMARGSAYELQTQILIAKKLGYIDETDADILLQKLQEILKMLTGLQNALK